MNEQNWSEPESTWWRGKEPGDSLTGTYVGMFESPARGMYKAQRVYQILAEDGKTWNFGLPHNRTKIHQSMQGVKAGQYIMITFSNYFDMGAGLQAAKSYKVKFAKEADGTYSMNTEWLNSQMEGSVEDNSNQVSQVFNEEIVQPVAVPISTNVQGAPTPIAQQGPSETAVPFPEQL